MDSTSERASGDQLDLMSLREEMNLILGQPSNSRKGSSALIRENDSCSNSDNPSQAIEGLRDRFAQLRAGLAESGKSGDLGSLYVRTCVLADMCEQLCELLLAGEGTSPKKPTKA